MRRLFFALMIGLAGCSVGTERAPEDSASESSVAEPPSLPPSRAASSTPLQDGPFSGVWEECDEEGAPDECGRYVLVQRGDRICGTWSYVATADLYTGQVQATALSDSRARRTRVCGRRGSETQTECDAGWETIDRPLQLCDGKLSESADASGACNGRYERSKSPGTQLEELEAKPWVKACLAATAEGAR